MCLTSATRKAAVCVKMEIAAALSMAFACPPLPKDPKMLCRLYLLVGSTRSSSLPRNVLTSGLQHRNSFTRSRNVIRLIK